MSLSFFVSNLSHLGILFVLQTRCAFAQYRAVLSTRTFTERAIHSYDKRQTLQNHELEAFLDEVPAYPVIVQLPCRKRSCKASDLCTEDAYKYTRLGSREIEHLTHPIRCQYPPSSTRCRPKTPTKGETDPAAIARPRRLELVSQLHCLLLLAAVVVDTQSDVAILGLFVAILAAELDRLELSPKETSNNIMWLLQISDRSDAHT